MGESDKRTVVPVTIFNVDYVIYYVHGWRKAGREVFGDSLLVKQIDAWLAKGKCPSLVAK